MAFHRAPKKSEQIHIILVEGVPRDKKLTTIVDSFNNTKSMIGVHRVTDYRTKISDTSAFVYLHDEEEYAHWRSTGRVNIAGNTCKLTFQNWYCTGIEREVEWKNSSFDNFKDGPVNLLIQNVRTAYKITTPHLYQILLPFESRYPKDLTGIKLQYNCNKRALRNFGFVSFNSRRPLEMYQYEHNVRVMDYDLLVKPTTKSFIILSQMNRHLLAGSPTLNADIKAANWLNFDSTIEGEPVAPPNVANEIQEDVLDITLRPGEDQFN